MSIQTVEPYVQPHNDADIQMVTGKLQNGKATGHDQILAKLIKWEEKGSRKSFMNSFQRHGRKRSYHKWKYGIICPIQGKGDMVCVITIQETQCYVQHTKFWQIFPM